MDVCVHRVRAAAPPTPQTPTHPRPLHPPPTPDPDTLKDEIGADAVGANDIFWEPAAGAQGAGECTVMQLCNCPEAGSHRFGWGGGSLTPAVSENIRLFQIIPNHSGRFHLAARGEANSASGLSEPD